MPAPPPGNCPHGYQLVQPHSRHWSRCVLSRTCHNCPHSLPWLLSHCAAMYGSGVAAAVMVKHLQRCLVILSYLLVLSSLLSSSLLLLPPFLPSLPLFLLSLPFSLPSSLSPYPPSPLTLLPPLPPPSPSLPPLPPSPPPSPLPLPPSFLPSGTGASCIYPLLGSKMNNWCFLATEIDDHSLRCAYDNVTRNGLQDKISGRDSHLTSCSTTVQPHATMHNH